MEGAGRRRSDRLAKKTGRQDKRTPRERTHDSVGGVLGLTPTRPNGRNLQVARAVDAAAAARLDELEIAERSILKRRESKKDKTSMLDSTASEQVTHQNPAPP